MTDMIHLVYGADDNYWFYTAISAASAAHGCSKPLTLHLFDIGISDEHYAEYERLVRRAGGTVTFVRHRLRAEDFARFGAWRGSLVTYSRMFIAELLPELDWAIYVDGDTLWFGDIAKLWALRDGTKLIQASVDPPFVDGTICPDRKWYAAQGLEIDPDAYLCMGLMMANLRKMREERIADRCRDFLAKYPKPGIVDQTVLNYVCKGRLTPLPKQWGVFSAWHVGVDLSDGGCVHYVTDVPWRRDKLNRLMSDIVLLWYDFAKEVLGLDLLPRYVPWFSRLWRRAAFVFLKHNQWILSLHPYLKGHLRNTAGLSDRRAGGRTKAVALAVANVLFYGWFDGRLLGVLVGMAVFCHVLARGIVRHRGDDCACRRLLSVGVVGCLAVLAVFKYFGFFVGSVAAALSAFGLQMPTSNLFNLLLPVGLSFYTFRGISYLVDVRRGTVGPARDFTSFFAYFSFFPQLLAGPIVRAGDFLPQLANRSGRPFADDLSAGLAMFAWGAVMKVALADSLAPLVDGRFAAWSLHSSPDMLIASVFYSFQIYGDFCGYSLMSLGVARVMGFRFADNFNAPYFSASFQEFWRRWHISLSTWLRDYLYIPLGGSRTGHTNRNLLVTMLLGGLWHGANWTFVAWGGFHGLMLGLERKVLDRLPEAWPVRFVRMLLVFGAVTLLWMFFRAETFAQAAGVIGRIFTVSGYRLGTVTNVFQVMRGFALIGLVLAGDLLILRGALYSRCERSAVWTALFCAFCVAVVLALGTFGGNTFIYQQF